METEVNSMMNFLQISQANLNDLERQRFKKILQDDCVPRKEVDLHHSIKFCMSYFYSVDDIR